ncbi:hypothetical protein DV735_g266, partial [Chaetothyriales sp. CBS 134920]
MVKLLDESLLKLADSVVVVSGGSTGIGAAVVSQLTLQGAKVVIGDVTEPAPAQAHDSGAADVTFVHTDVRKYQDIIRLFDTALSKYGHVDHAIAAAGTPPRRGPAFDPKAGIEGIRHGPPEEDDGVLEINSRGALWFAHVAVQYLSHDGGEDEEGKSKDGGSRSSYRNKSLTLTASIASWLEFSGLVAYQASQHSVLGIVRSLRRYLPAAFGDKIDGGIRVNSVSPILTYDDDNKQTLPPTAAIETTQKAWVEAGLEASSVLDVARVIVGCARAGWGTQAIWYDGKDAPGLRQRAHYGAMDWVNDEPEARGMNGRNWVLIGGKSYDTEESYDRTMDLWLGAPPAAQVREALKVLGPAGDWVNRQQQ